MMMMIVVIVTQLNKYFSGQCVYFCRDSKSGERGEHALAIFLPLLC